MRAYVYVGMMCVCMAYSCVSVHPYVSVCYMCVGPHVCTYVCMRVVSVYVVCALCVQVYLCMGGWYLCRCAYVWGVCVCVWSAHMFRSGSLVSCSHSLPWDRVPDQPWRCPQSLLLRVRRPRASAVVLGLNSGPDAYAASDVTH